MTLNTDNFYAVINKRRILYLINFFVETYSELSQTSVRRVFWKELQALNIFAKSSFSVFWQGSEYASDVVLSCFITAKTNIVGNASPKIFKNKEPWPPVESIIKINNQSLQTPLVNVALSFYC